MSKRTVKETKEVEKTIYSCDLCGEEYKLGLACRSGYHHCIICERDICNKCSRSNPLYDDGWDDSVSAICKDCNEIVAPFKIKLEELSLRHRKESKEFWEELRKKAKENIEKKNQRR